MRGTRPFEEPLVIFPGALGDLVCFEPSLAVIRRRSERPVRILCKGSLASLVEAAGLGLAEPIEGRASAWLFSPSPPAEADEFFAGFSSIDCFTGAGVPEVEANLRRWKPGSARVHPFRPTTRIHLAMHFLRSIGAAGGALPEPALRFPADRLAVARRAISGLLNRPPTLVVHPGSGGSRKRWSRAGFRAIVDRWIAESRTAVALLGPAESEERAFWGASGAAVMVSPDWVTMAATLEAPSLYLGNDSGPSHFAAAVGARGVALFGASDPECWRPLSSRMRVLRPDPWSSGDDAPAASTVDEVWNALSAAIDGARSEKSP